MYTRVLLLTPIIALLALNGQARNASEVDIQAVFDGLLKIERMMLGDEEYNERLGLFGLHYLAGDDNDAVNIQMMYDLDELARQNGAKPVRLVESMLKKRLQKREAVELGSSTPSYFDGRKYRGKTIINEVVHQGICGNCYLHTFIAALELGYFKGSGEMIKFSEQEMTDCYNNGCEGGDFKMVSITMSYIDKVSTREGYGEFLSKQVTCRANTTPDALMKIKVVDYIDVQTETVEAAILKYGSVMTCMKWGSAAGSECYMSQYKAGDIVDYPEVKKGCDHAVLIVGYTPEYYIVRNSHGKTWGEDGYFRIKRGINSCGIEEDMAALVIESRHQSKAVSSNGCPLDRPHLCEKIHTCTAQTECSDPLEEEEEEEEQPASMSRHQGSGAASRSQMSGSGSAASQMSRQEMSQSRGIPSGGSASSQMSRQEMSQSRGIPSGGSHMSRESMSRSSGESQKMSLEDAARMQEQLARSRGRGGAIPRRMRRRLKKRSHVAGDVFGARRVKRATCEDRVNLCGTLKTRGIDVCAAGSRYADNCHDTCGTCDQVAKKAKPKPDEKTGECIPPYIPHGTILNENEIMKANEELEVKCKSGYTLVGSTNRCLIQDIFTNDDKDARLLPECIKLGEDKLVGDGSDYQGTKNSYFFHGRWFECDSWNFDVLRGVLMGERKGLELLLGNHNYCRNPGGMEPVPFCIGSARGLGEVVYCFGHPGCDTCAGAVDKYNDPGYCNTQKRFCTYTDKATRNRVAAVQQNCAATCCAAAGCSTS